MPLFVSRSIKTALIVLIVGALYLAQLHDGMNTILGGLVLAVAEASLLIALLPARWMRRAVFRLPDDLLWPAVAFGLTLLVALWSLTPWVPGGAHPAWSYVNALGAATLDRSSTLFEIVKLGGLACVFLVAYALGRSDQTAIPTTYALALIGALYAVGSMVWFGSHREPGVERLPGSFQSANTAATLFAALLAIACSLMVRAVRRAPRRGSRLVPIAAAAPYGSLAMLFAVGLLLTASRGGVAAALVALLVFFALELVAGRVSLRAGLIGVSLGGVALAVVSPLLIGRVLELHHGKFDRVAMFDVYWRAFLQSPLMGYGLGTFDIVNKLNLSASTIENWTARAAHNVYLQWLLEGGLIGAFPMFVCVGLILFQTGRGLMGRQRSTSVIRGLLAADIVFLTHGWTDFALQVPGMAAYWAFLLGLQLGLAKGSSVDRL